MARIILSTDVSAGERKIRKALKKVAGTLVLCLLLYIHICYKSLNNVEFFFLREQ
jgi:hypothetical protein